MKKALLITISAVALTHGDAVKLVNKKTGFVVVEFNDEKIQFNDRFLQAELTELGIDIPPAFRKSFNGKKKILIDDPLFQKAFIEVYYPLTIANSDYSWEKTK